MIEKNWTPEEIRELRLNYSTMGAAVMAKSGMCGGRRAKNISQKARTMGLSFEGRKLWSGQDLDELDEYYAEIGPTAMNLAGMCSGRSAKAIGNKAWFLEIAFTAETVASRRDGTVKQVKRPAPPKKPEPEVRSRPASSIWDMAARSS